MNLFTRVTNYIRDYDKEMNHTNQFCVELKDDAYDILNRLLMNKTIKKELKKMEIL